MPSPLAYNLLDEALLGVEDERGRNEKVTLPGLLARLSGGSSTALTALQAHQQHAVHAFLVQLAALSLARAGKTEISQSDSSWRQLVLGAAEADGAGVEAFILVVENLGLPAFLQPPVPEGTLEVLKNNHERPGAELDVLITSKNHDVKIDRVSHPTIEDWVFALICLQTTQGFLGAGNYGIARMNGGFASRPCVAFASDYRAGPRFVRDVRALLGARSSLKERFGYGSRGTLGLVWCRSWSGKESLSLSELDPFFIEVCRRVRLRTDSAGNIVAYRGSSSAPRVDAKDAKGNTGDAWTPVSRLDGKALTVPDAGFTYERVQDLLFGEDWAAGAAGEAIGGSGDCVWLGQVLVRGQGKTGGYHERWVPMPPKVRRFFAEPGARAALGARSRAWVERSEVARRKVLRPALLALLQGGPEGDRLKFDDNRADFYLRRLDGAIDQEFFPLLFEHAEDPPEVADATFEKRLVDLARKQLEDASEGLPVPLARRWRAEAQSHRAFFDAARKHFKLAFPARIAPPTDSTGLGDRE